MVTILPTGFTQAREEKKLCYCYFTSKQLLLISQSDWLICVVDKSLDNAARVNVSRNTIFQLAGATFHKSICFFYQNRAIYTRKIRCRLHKMRTEPFLRARLIEDAKCLYKWFTDYSFLMTHFCVGCQSASSHANVGRSCAYAV